MKNGMKLLLVAAAAVVVAIIIANAGDRQTEAASADAGNPRLGDGDLTVFLFEDYMCSHCRDYALGPNFQHLLDTWVTPGNVTVVFKHITLNPQAWPYSDDAGRASQCVYSQAPAAWHAWDHDAYTLVGDGYAPSEQNLRILTEQSGLDMDAYDGCMADPAPLDDVLAQNLQQFHDIGAGGTPTLAIGTKLFNPNDTAAVDAAIQEALDAA